MLERRQRLAAAMILPVSGAANGKSPQRSSNPLLGTWQLIAASGYQGDEITLTTGEEPTGAYSVLRWRRAISA